MIHWRLTNIFISIVFPLVDSLYLWLWLSYNDFFLFGLQFALAAPCCAVHFVTFRCKCSCWIRYLSLFFLFVSLFMLGFSSLFFHNLLRPHESDILCTAIHAFWIFHWIIVCSRKSTTTCYLFIIWNGTSALYPYFYLAFRRLIRARIIYSWTITATILLETISVFIFIFIKLTTLMSIIFPCFIHIVWSTNCTIELPVKSLCKHCSFKW